MKTKIKLPEVPFNRREHFIHQRCAYLCDNELQKAVIEGRFVLAWDGELNTEDQIPALGVLEAVRMNRDGSRTYVITSEHGTERIEYQNAVVLREDWCPEVAFKDKSGTHYIRRWIGLQERKDGKVYAVITNSSDDSSRDVDPSTLIFLDNCDVGLPEREEA